MDYISSSTFGKEIPSNLKYQLTTTSFGIDYWSLQNNVSKLSKAENSSIINKTNTAELCRGNEDDNTMCSTNKNSSLNEFVSREDNSLSQNENDLNWFSETINQLSTGNFASQQNSMKKGNQSGTKDDVLSKMGSTVTPHHRHGSSDGIERADSTTEKLSQILLKSPAFNDKNLSLSSKSSSSNTNNKNITTNKSNFPQQSLVGVNQNSSKIDSAFSKISEGIDKTNISHAGDEQEVTNGPTLNEFRTHGQTTKARQFGKRVSSLLDSLLLGYDKRLRPDFGPNPFMKSPNTVCGHFHWRYRLEIRRSIKRVNLAVVVESPLFFSLMSAFVNSFNVIANSSNVIGNSSNATMF
ncbi:hypothetical protein PoB_003584400 [Plakobranchus ocellatus]|uniref:Uncharacterized protein n=1 Tax=Plakobranchus ocellatus TaxID=259542 RepID=A0AAV4ASM9_9GAST|nr:hypothetical protein PoB_003584400 [Plakobranchus ocellatus]